MPDYKAMYITMIDATEKAMDILIKAQQQCEEIYITQSEKENITVLDNANS